MRTFIAIGTFLLAFAPAAALAAPRAGEWPGFKRDVGHTGFIDRNEAMGAMGGTPCKKWEREVTSDFPYARNGSGVIAAKIPRGGRPQSTIFVAAGGRCLSRDTVNRRCNESAPGTVFALDGATGEPVWSSPLVFRNDKGVAIKSQTDIYAPILIDVDSTDDSGPRELIVNASGADAPGWANDRVFAFRTEAEMVDGAWRDAGTLRWTFTYTDDAGIEDTTLTSEAAPTAADVDGDRYPEILIGTGRTGGQPVAAKFFAIDGRTGRLKGAPVVGRRRTTIDPPREDGGGGCTEENKMDSSSPTIASVDGKTTVLAGSWDGQLYAMQWSATDHRLFSWATLPLPDLLAADAGGLPFCKVGKVRNSPVVMGDGKVAFGFMYERARNAQDFDTARFRVVELGRNGFGPTTDFAQLRAWKSSPSLAPTSRGTAIVGGCLRCVFSMTRDAAGAWSPLTKSIGDGNNISGTWGGNRSSPAVADMNGNADARYEIVVGVESGTTSDQPGLYAFDAETLVERWHVPLGSYGVTAAPAVADLDGDRPLETAVLALDGKVYAFDDTCP